MMEGCEPPTASHHGYTGDIQALESLLRMEQPLALQYLGIPGAAPSFALILVEGCFSMDHPRNLLGAELLPMEAVPAAASKSPRALVAAPQNSCN